MVHRKQQFGDLQVNAGHEVQVKLDMNLVKKNIFRRRGHIELFFVWQHFSAKQVQTTVCIQMLLRSWFCVTFSPSLGLCSLRGADVIVVILRWRVLVGAHGGVEGVVIVVT